MRQCSIWTVKSVAALLPLVTLLVVPRSGLALVQDKIVDFASFEKVALAELAETHTPGMAVALVKGDRVVFAKGFGVSSLETREPVTTDTLFRVGSTTKTFTAAALVRLAEEGKVNLEAPIQRYVAGLPPWLGRITAHQLLSHTGGLKDEPADFGPHDESQLATAIRSWKEDYLLLEPGRAFSYSNPGFALAGLLLQEIEGKPYREAIGERLLKPLGMSRSTFLPTVAMTYPLAQGHEPGRDGALSVVRPYSDDASKWPNGFLFTSAAELARFATALLNEGMLEGVQVLSRSVIRSLETSHTEVLSPLPDMGRARYGYGFFLHEEAGLDVVEHSGAMPGFISTFKLVPEERIAVILLVNRTAMLPKTTAMALEILSGRSAPPEAPATPAALPMGEAEMASYVGKYANRWTEEILIQDGKLFLKRGPGLWPVTKLGPTRFLATPPGGRPPQEFTLLPGADGKPESLCLFLWAFKRTASN